MADSKLFTVKVVTRDVAEFRRHAEMAARLKPYGRVAVDVCNLAEPTPYGLPPGANAWHDYLVWHESLIDFFPHPKLLPYLSREHIDRNRKLLSAKVKVLEEIGLGAFFRAVEPFFWPEAFFRDHPHLRGPRIDHPRRSIREEFAPCVDLPETREMFEWMMSELKKNVPMLSSVTIHINDAGSGLCWHAALYSGRQGPAHCEHVDPGDRVQQFVETLMRGAEAGGGRVRMGITGCFWNNEVYTIEPKLPPDTFLHSYKSDAVNVHRMGQDPIRGILNPLAIISAMENYDRPDAQEFFFYLHCNNILGGETPETVNRLMDIVEDCIGHPHPHTARGRLDKLHSLCEAWGGNTNADALFETFLGLDSAVRLKNTVQPGCLTRTCGATARHFVRPLVIRPELLTPEEESYFLPYIFNIRENEARMDYMDLHGGRLAINPALRAAGAEIVAVADRLESFDDAPESEWLTQLALSLRMWASALRSACNFHQAQVIRERNAELLASPERIPEKTRSFYGDEDNIPWNEVQRDEFDNAAEFLAVLQRGGRGLICCAEKPEEEMSFALPADLEGAVGRKMAIMRAHWRDVEKHIAPPHK